MVVNLVLSCAVSSFGCGAMVEWPWVWYRGRVARVSRRGRVLAWPMRGPRFSLCPNLKIMAIREHISYI